MMHLAFTHFIIALIVFIMVMVIAVEDARTFSNSIFHPKYLLLIVLYTIAGFIIVEAILWVLDFIIHILI